MSIRRVIGIEDMSEAAHDVLTAIYRRMSPAEKFAVMEQMTDETREVARCGIRSRHPDYTPDEVEHALHRLWLGDDLADRAWPSFTHLVP